AQRMWMEYHGEYADGTPYFEATYTANLVTDDGVSQGILPPTPVDELRLLKDGSCLSIQFWVSFNRTSDKSSAVLFRIREHTIQALPGVLPHPFIDGASGTGPNVTIADPLSIENNMRVSVAYAMAPTDGITLEMIFLHGTPHTASLDGQAGGTVVFSLSNAILARCVNSIVCLRYSVLRNGQTTPSNVQTVTFGTIAAANLPRPLINNIANGGTLDLNTFSGNATASVAKWRLSAAKQRVWLTCSSAGVADLDVLKGVEISATEATNGLVNKPVLRSWLAALPTGRQIAVTFKVTFDGSTDETSAVLFPTTTYRLVQRPKLSHNWDFNDNTFQGWSPQGNYANGNLAVGNGYVSSYTQGYLNFSGPVMTCTIQVHANSSYDLGFSVTAISNTGYFGSSLYLTLNGAAIGSAVDTQNQIVWRNGTGFFTSSVTGSVTLGLNNQVVDDRGNDFAIDNIWIRER
ncbi:MAG: hypothetical protein ACRC1I_06925, partial [Pseudomonas proteolytica]